ncbi:MAG: ATP-dependent Clp protease ATP-binding subunit [Polyangiaceae bacterium]
MSRRVEPELVDLRKLAQSLAEERKEKFTSAHLLAAITCSPSPARELLAERRIVTEDVLRVARGTNGDVDDAVRCMVQKARGIATRMGADETRAIHLLVALVGERRSRSFRTLEALGIDVGRLRTAAMNLGLGISVPRRSVSQIVEKERPKQAVALSCHPVRPASASPIRPTNASTVRPIGVPPAPKAVKAELVPDPTCPMALAKRETTSSKGKKAALPPAPVPPASERPAARSPLPAAPVSRGPSRAAAAAVDAAKHFALDPARYPTLCSLGVNLTELCARGELEPVVGREREVEQILDVLAKRRENSPLLVGMPGVGKTSVVRALANYVVSRRSDSPLDDRIVIEIPTSDLIAGTGVRGALATRLGAVRKEVEQAGGRVVLFFDEIHRLFGEAAEEIAGDLKLGLQRGQLPCIGTTTPDELRRVLEADPALSRRFTLVEVDEPNREDAFLILEALSGGLASHHGVGYANEALAMAVAWSLRYLPGRALPDKAVQIIDLAGARARRRNAVSVEPELIAEVVAESADMPVERLLESDADRLLTLEDIVAGRVVGHGDAVGRIASILRRNAAGMGARRPIGTFLLLGPTGVGKTEMAKAVAEVLFHSETAMTRLDLSEYSEAHAVARLIGAPPGYVGHEAGGLLTEAVRRRPYQVLLLDEIEKAHSDVLEAFLGVFDEGRMTDGRGRTVDFTNTVIFMTSNIGAGEFAAQRRPVGFGAAEQSDAPDVEKRMIAAARAALTPELYNRIDEVLCFTPLARAEVLEIARRLLAQLDRALEQRRGVRVEADEAALAYLLDNGGFEPSLGARPLKRTLARLVEAPLADKILRGELSRGSVALISVNESGLAFDVIDPDITDSDATAAE